MNVLYQTRTGVCAAIARRFEFVCVSWTLRWAEQDRALLAQQVERLPEQLKQADIDIQHLRVKQALLQPRR